MKKSNVLAVTAAASVFAATALADTILWYRFDGSGDTVVNAANPGFMDGKLKSIKSGWGTSDYVLGDDSAKFPVPGGAAFPRGFTVYDPVGGTNCPAPHAMSWSNEAHYGFVVAEDASGLHTKKTMTVEAFFRIKPGGGQPREQDASDRKLRMGRQIRLHDVGDGRKAVRPNQIPEK